MDGLSLPTAAVVDSEHLLQEDSCRRSWAGSVKDSDRRSATCPFDQRIPPRLVFFSMFKFLAGLGTLSVPKAMADLGIVGYVAVNLFFALLSSGGCHLLGRVLDLLGREDMNAAEAGEMVLGRFGYCLSFTSNFMDNWGATVAYWKTMSGTIQHILQNPAALGDSLHTLSSTWFLVVAFAALVGPLVGYRRLSTLSWILHLGNASMVIFIGAVFVNAIVQRNDGLSVLPTASFDMEAVVACTVLAYSYDCQVNVFFNYRELDRTVGAKSAAMTKASTAAIMGYMVVVISVGFAACDAFAVDGSGSGSGSSTLGMNANILNNFEYGWMAVKLFVVLSAVPVIPLLCFENVAMLQDHCLTSWSSRKSNVIGSMLMVVSTAFAAAVVPGLYAVLAYMGATTALCQICVIPPLFFLVMVRKCYYTKTYQADDRDPDAQDLPPHPPIWEVAFACASLVFGVLGIPFGLWVTIRQT